MQGTVAPDDVRLLCSKGLAVSGVLVPLATSAEPASRIPGALSPALQQLQRDETTIRTVFNQRYPAIDVFDMVARQAEVEKRTALLCVVYRLYGTGRNCTPPELRRELLAFEVDALLSCLQRLALMGHPSWDALVDHCERAAAADDDVLAHVMDPLGLRFLLTFHSPQLSESINGHSLAPLETSCRLCDRGAIRAWFGRLLSGPAPLPNDAPQRLRALLLELWRAGVGDLGMLSHEIAVLDVTLFEDLGWESTRLFCAQLRRITGPRSEALDAYLTDEDIDGALLSAEELRQDELTAHFRRLAVSYDTKLHRDVRRSVYATAHALRRHSA